MTAVAAFICLQLIFLGDIDGKQKQLSRASLFSFVNVRGAGAEGGLSVPSQSTDTEGNNAPDSQQGSFRNSQ